MLDLVKLRLVDLEKTILDDPLLYNNATNNNSNNTSSSSNSNGSTDKTEKKIL